MTAQTKPLERVRAGMVTVLDQATARTRYRLAGRSSYMVHDYVWHTQTYIAPQARRYSTCWSELFATEPIPGNCIRTTRERTPE